MRTLQLVKSAILFPLLVLATITTSTPFVLAVSSDSESGEITDEPINLEEDSAVLPSSPDTEAAGVKLPKIAIYAVNPGYNLPIGNNSGELIELVNLSDEELDLSGLEFVYTSKPTSTSPEGKSTTLYTFPDGATFVGNTILFRYAKSPEALDGAQDLTYDSTSIAMAGSLKLVQNGTVISSVCWLGGEECLSNFSTTVKSRSYTTILLDLETGKYFHAAEYTPTYNPEKPGLYIPTDDDTGEGSDDESATVPETTASTITNSIANTSSCLGLHFSEFLTYYTDSSDEQFIEIYNSSNQSIPLNSCWLKYKNKSYPLSTTSLLLAPDSYFVFYPSTAFTKDPSSTNLYELQDDDGEIIDSFSLPHGQKKSTSLALMGENPDGSNLWQITYSPTPGSPNVHQEFRSCPVGKVINVATGNCINVATLETVEKDCGVGKYRNPLTGRCKSYDSDSSGELTPCAEGYERNPETNRCRKIKQNNGADYPLVPITDSENNTSFVAIWALIGIIILGFCYVIFQFRRDIYYFIRRLANKLKK